MEIVPLIVDVDGSLVSDDLLIEGVLRLLADSPLNIFKLPFWLVSDPSTFRRRVERSVPLPPETLVFNPMVTEEITEAKAAGREAWLVSRSDKLVVAPIAETVGATGYFASDEYLNLVGQARANFLVKKFGAGGFDYIGNSKCDLAVWKHARHAIGVNLSENVVRELKKLDKSVRFLSVPDNHPLDCFRALRPYQWIKNLLVFVPLIAAHQTNPELYLKVTLLFLALSICASGMYLLNDLLDLPYDRQHKIKRHRPLAAGEITLSPAIGISSVMILTGVSAAYWLSVTAGSFVLLYVGLSLAYSLSLKRKTFIDVIVLALLFNIRVLAGAAVAAVILSQWFLIFFTFIFLALAIVKRQSELYVLHETGKPESDGRAYHAKDIAAITSLGAASSLASVVVLSLYLYSAEVSEAYTHPEIMWGMIPLLVYWLGRIALLANRGVIKEDPVLFALHDRASWLALIGILTLFAAAI